MDEQNFRDKTIQLPRQAEFSLISLPKIVFFFFHQLINKGKGEALRIRAILRSLVPTEDLVGIISIPLKMPIVNKGTFTQHQPPTRHLIGEQR